MGHIQLYTLPDTRRWRGVVGMIAEGATAAEVAAATTEAAAGGLEMAATDRGVARVVYLLARLARAAGRDDFTAALSDDGIAVPPDPGLFDLTAGLASAARGWLAAEHIRRSDLAEMAILAATETLARHVGDFTPAFLPAAAEVREAVRGLAAPAGFTGFAHAFFARFAHRFLMYHLGRELPLHVGGDGRFADSGEHDAFVAQVEAHCRAAAAAARPVVARWCRAPEFRAGVGFRRARAVTARCIGRVAAALEVPAGGGRD